MTLNGCAIDWQDASDLPSYCGMCPFWWGGGDSYIPGVSSHSTAGICNLRCMNKDRYADTPQACLRLFRKCLKYPADTELVVVLKD